MGLKRNHPKLFDAIQTVIKKVGESDENRLHDAFEKRNGRTVRRRYFGFDISSLPESTAWTDLKSVIAVESITSKDNDPDRKVTAT